jgi:hypothetical protein
LPSSSTENEHSRRDEETRETEPDSGSGGSKEKRRDSDLKDQRKGIGLRCAVDDLLECVASRGELGRAEDEVVGQGDRDDNVGGAAKFKVNAYNVKALKKENDGGARVNGTSAVVRQ